jgi:multidrug efflux pump subunit AcrB
MRQLVSWAVRNSPALNTLMVGVLLAGLASLWAMRREVFPEFDLEIILVTVPYPGASPAEVEEGICQKIEEAVRSIAGIKKQTAVAQEGAGFLVLELESDVRDAQRILNEVRSEIDRIPSFPELIEEPQVTQITLRYPVIRIGVIGPQADGMESELQLREVAEQVRYDILRLPSVSQATILGAKEYQIDIEMSEDTLREYGLTLQHVAEIVRRENVELPGGRMKSESQEVLLRGKNKRQIGREIAQIPLVTQPNGVVLTVGDLGYVSDAFADETAISQINGKPGLVVSVDRTSREDLFAIVDQVKDYVASAQLPPGYSLIAWSDRSVEVRDRMQLLLRNGLQGLVLVFLLLAVFLDLRLAFWVAWGIPLSILGAGAVLWGAGHTMNMLSMFGFLMTLGIVVDDAIVIGENIYEHRQRGKEFVQAAIDGTLEVLPSVVSSVATTLIAFVPLMFVSGVMGKFIAVLPVAVIATLTISLLEATFILPCHLAHSREHRPRRYGAMVARVRRFCQRLPVMLGWTVGPILVGLAFVAEHLAYPFERVADLFHWISEHAIRGMAWFNERAYRPTLQWVIRNPVTVICSAMSLLLISYGLVRAGVTPFVVFPKLDNNEILVRITYPDGTPAGVTDAATSRLLAAIQRVNAPYEAEGKGFIRTTRRTVGELTMPGVLGPETRASGSHVGAVEVELVETSQRDITSEEILSRWRLEDRDFPGVESLIYGASQRGPGGPPIEFKLLANADHFDRLEEAVEACKKRLGEYPGVVDIRDDSRPGKWEFQLQIKDKAIAMGVPLADLAESVRASYYGAEVMRLQRGRHEVKLMVRYPPEERRTLVDFDDIRIRTGSGAERPLTELAHVQVARGYSEINRVDQQRSITITADIVEDVANARQIVSDLEANFMPGLLARYPDVHVRWEGQQEQTIESVRSLLVGFIVAVIAMYVLLTAEFRSYIQPLIILASIPFGFVGAIWGHALLGMPLTMFTLFGLVTLSGIVVNDSIVLIDFINARLAERLPLDQALLEAGRRRFRPVFLTSITTMAGLFPLLMETSFQAQILIPMAATIVFGLAVTTVTALILVPALYAVYWRLVFSATAHEPLAEPLVPAYEVVPVPSAPEPVLTHRR